MVRCEGAVLGRIGGAVIGLAVLAVGLSAQRGSSSPESTQPRFAQASANVFRRFAVDLDRMKEFYGAVLGLGALPPIGLPGGGQMTRFHVGTTEVKLQPSAAEARAPQGSIRDVIGLRVLTFFYADEHALADRFTSHGLAAPAFHRRGGGSERAALVKDPSGQWVELVVRPGAPATVLDSIEIGLAVSDLERSRAFYRDFVGLEEAPPASDDLLGVDKRSFRLGTTTISLWPARPGAAANTTSAGIQYVVANVDEVDARAKARGVRIDRPLANVSATLRTVWLADPDGITNYFAQVGGRPAAATGF